VGHHTANRLPIMMVLHMESHHLEARTVHRSISRHLDISRADQVDDHLDHQNIKKDA
jgi:hypothetical protein